MEELAEGRRYVVGQGRDADEGDAQQLEMQVDSEEYNLSIAGERLPNILRLKLNESKIPSIRDLGTGWKNLRILWLSRCGLEDLQGMSALPSLTELYVSFNDVCDITPVADLENLEVLDLESNRVEDLNGVEYLGFCRSLVQLTLEGNPVCAQEGYRRRVVNQIPQLVSLDDFPVTERDREAPKEADEAVGAAKTENSIPASAMAERDGSPSEGDAVSTSEEEPERLEDQLRRLESAELALISDGIKYTRMEPREAPLCYLGKDAVTLEDLFQNFNENLPVTSRTLRSRPSSALGFSRTGRRQLARPSTAMGGPRRPKAMAAGRQRDDGAGAGDGGSSLTMGGDGGSLAGNAAKALLQRKSRRGPEDGGDAQVESEPSTGSEGSHSRQASAEMDMLEELKKWKLTNNVSFGSFSEEDDHVTYSCSNLEPAAALARAEASEPKAAAVAPSPQRPPRPIVPARIKQLGSVVIRDENVPVRVNCGQEQAMAAAKAPDLRSSTTLDRYDQYSSAAGDYQVMTIDHAPVPPRPQSSKGGGFQRKAIVRSGGPIKVDRRSMNAARMRRIGGKKAREGMQGLQDKIENGAENW